MPFYVCRHEPTCSSLELASCSRCAESSHRPVEVDQVSVRCPTPSALLQHLGLKASDIDVLQLDMEGFDVKTLEGFLVLEGFAPTLVQFEWTHVARVDGGAESRPLRQKFFSTMNGV